jgi:hypothetical protein
LIVAPRVTVVNFLVTKLGLLKSEPIVRVPPIPTPPIPLKPTPPPAQTLPQQSQPPPPPPPPPQPDKSPVQLVQQVIKPTVSSGFPLATGFNLKNDLRFYGNKP